MNLLFGVVVSIVATVNATVIVFQVIAAAVAVAAVKRADWFAGDDVTKADCVIAVVYQILYEYRHTLNYEKKQTKNPIFTN